MPTAAYGSGSCTRPVASVASAAPADVATAAPSPDRHSAPAATTAAPAASLVFTGGNVASRRPRNVRVRHGSTGFSESVARAVTAAVGQVVAHVSGEDDGSADGGPLT